MLVTVWRHGEAGYAASDANRMLTDRGRYSVGLAAEDCYQWLGDMALAAPDCLRYSPLRRTEETARLLGDAWGLTPQVSAALAPGADHQSPQTFLPEDYNHVVLVSHQPFVSMLIGYWLDDRRLSPLMPGGWATIDLIAACRGGGTLLRLRSSVFH